MGDSNNSSEILEPPQCMRILVSGFFRSLFLSSLVNELCALYRVGVTFLCIAFSQISKESIITRELCQIFTSCFNAYSRTTLHAICVDQRKVIASVNQVIKHVGRRKVTMQKPSSCKCAAKRAKWLITSRCTSAGSSSSVCMSYL